ncbi:hypothetical protein GF340_02595 [Candidatus Peregrinibacteria bacterium]|nr:hypothetical protein [Candidatus Peregrinibacteria bacterium]
MSAERQKTYDEGRADTTPPISTIRTKNSVKGVDTVGLKVASKRAAKATSNLRSNLAKILGGT